MFFVNCHPASLPPMTEFVQVMEESREISGQRIQMIDLKTVLEGKSVDTLGPEELERAASTVAEICKIAERVICDVGHQFTEAFFRALAKVNDRAVRIAYYDNLEAYVPGGYSDHVQRLVNSSEGRPNRIVFANKNFSTHPPFPLGDIEARGIGYNNLKMAETIQKLRSDKLREAFFRDIEVSDTGQKILTYFGGANEVYFSESFPKFLELLKDSNDYLQSSELIVLFQQHPRAKQLGDRDGALLRAFQHPRIRIIFSTYPFENAAALAQLGVYDQTSAVPLLLRARIPLMQVRTEPFKEQCYNAGMIYFANRSDTFNRGLAELGKNTLDISALDDVVGFDPNWKDQVVPAFGP